MQNSIHYKTAGVCSSAIDLEITDGVISKAQIVGGCPGVSQALQTLLDRGGLKPTSCPDQMAKALEAMIAG